MADPPGLGALVKAFSQIHGRHPAVVVRAPGRVNLIGEHTDYSLLPVLPLAIPPAVLVAAAEGGGAISARSLSQPGEAVVDPADPDLEQRGWGRFVAAAATQLGRSPRGARLLVGGDLTADGGLSSSSALTIGVLAALAAVWETPPEPERLVAMAVAAERRVGIEGGAMDQTVIVHARAGSALRIDFRPPGRRHVAMPPGLELVVAHSGEAAAKGGAAGEHYNGRVVGCRLAAALLAAELGAVTGDPPLLADVAGLRGVGPAAATLPGRSSPAAAAARLDIDPGSLVRLAAGRFDAGAEVPVRSSAEHVLAEALRVDEMERALEAGDLAAIGGLLDASHASLGRFGATTPGLDAVVSAMREAGALGARLTGAGFGGFAVAAVRPALADAVVAAGMATGGGPAFPVAAADGLRFL